MSDNCLIYVLENTANNKVYVGQTWRSLEERFDSGFGYKHCLRLFNAIQKYGRERFKYTILVTAADQMTADYMERFWINVHDSRDPDVGYNLTDGGSYGKHSKESKRKMSDAQSGSKNHNYGKKMSEEQKLKISIANAGENNSNYGKTTTEDVKQKLSLANKGKPNPKNKGRVWSDEHKKNLSQKHSGANNPNYCKSLSKETKEKMSAAKKGKAWIIIDGKRTLCDKL